MKNIILILLLICSSSMFSQKDKLKISGSVIDINGNAIPSVSITADDSSVSTDLQGNYTIFVKNSKSVLKFTFIGFDAQIVVVGKNREINITMTESKNELDEVVVIGYGSQKRSNVTGSVAKYKNERLDEAPVSRLDQALQGKIAGVQIQNISSEAGADPKIQIRGISSINAGANPLVVIDGQPVPDGLASINPSDVESIEVLKDAASSAIYGSRGASGVILITTKSGKTDKVKYVLKYATGFKTPYKIYQSLTSTEYVQKLYSNFKLLGVDPNDPALGVQDADRAAYAIEQNFLGGKGTNYQDEVLRVGIFRNIILTATGGTKDVKYYISGAYNQDEGMMLKSNSERYTFRSKIDINLSKKVKLSVNLNPSFNSVESPSQNLTNFTRFQSYLPVYHNAITAAWANQNPLWNVKPGDFSQPRHYSGQNYTATMPDGSIWSGANNIGPQDGTTQNNPISNLLMQDINTNTTRFQGGTNLTVNLLPGLDFKTLATVYTNFSKRLDYSNKNAGGDGIVSKGIYTDSSIRDLLTENTLSYKKEFKDHSIDLLAGFTAQTTKSTRQQTTGLNYADDSIRTLNNALSIDKAGTFGTETEVGLLSYLGRINYAYQGKYILSASIRADGSSYFGVGNKWGTFPAVSAGWTVNKEKFLENVKWMNKLMLRASYGVSGNNRILDYSFTNLLVPGNYNLGAGSGSPVLGLNPAAAILGNRDITWESTHQANFGADISLFDNRLTLAVDAYQSETDKLLLQQSNMAFTGVPLYWNNIGSLSNRGFEFELSTINIKSKNFKWSTSANISHNQNKILALGNETFLRSQGERTEIYQSNVGDPLIQFFGYKTDGVWLSQAQIDQAIAGGLTSDLPQLFTPGGLKLVDVNGDGKIDTNDRTVIGNPYPDFIWGVTNTFNYKSIDLSFSFQGSQGGQLINGDMNYLENKKTNPSYTDGQWLSAEFPGDGQTPYERNGFANWVITDYAVSDASYISLREVNVGYTLPKPVSKALKLTNIRIYYSAQNLFFYSAKGYKGINPEARTNSGPANSLIDGYQRGGFPIPKTVVFGVDINF